MKLFMLGGRRQALFHQVSYQTNTEKSSFFSFLRGFISHFAKFLGPSDIDISCNFFVDKALSGKIELSLQVKQNFEQHNILSLLRLHKKNAPNSIFSYKIPLNISNLLHTPFLAQSGKIPEIDRVKPPIGKGIEVINIYMAVITTHVPRRRVGLKHYMADSRFRNSVCK